MLSLETPRLHLTALTLEDLPSIARWEADPVLLDLNDDDVNPVPFSEVEATIRSWTNPGRDDIAPFGVRLREGAQLIGWCMLAKIDRTAAECRVGLTIGARGLWGQGFGGEVLRALVDHAFGTLALRRIVAEVHEFNERSRRLFEGAGFRLIERRAAAIRRGDRLHDGLVLALDADGAPTTLPSYDERGGGRL